MSDHNRLNPHIPQFQPNTSGETSGNPHHIEQNTSLSVPSAGMFNHSANTHVQHSIFNEISGSQNRVVNNIMNGPHVAAMPSLYQLLQPVNASYRDRAGKRARCLQGTRKDVLTTIQKWVDQLETSQPICWLNGPAGFGKSTIAQTIAEWCADQKRLAASFFFFRGMGHREKISHLIPTLAFQLSSTVRGMEPLLKNALDKEPYILNTPLNYQFDILIMEPIIACNRKRLPVVIVIDALDECIRQSGVSMEEFIDVVVDACGARKSQVPFRLFITSRIEEHLRKKLEIPDAAGVMLQLKLQNFDATEDIRMFFESEFKRIYHANRKLMLMDKVPQPWPSPEILDVLVKKAAGSYIYSSTFVDFVSEKGGMPHQKLLDALKAHGLDNLYSQVFSNALYPGGTPVAMAELVRIMGVLLLLRYTLSIKELATFLNIPPRTLVEYFLSIQSILLIPESDNDPVQLVHTSLRDFLMTPARSGTYFIDPPIRHISIAIGCLDIMTKNKTEFLFEKEPLQYASTEWLAHLRKALCEGDQCPSDLSLFVSLKDSLTSFASSSLDPWLHSMIVYTMRHGMESRFPPLELSQCPQSLQSTLTSLNNMLDQTVVRTVSHFTWCIMMNHLQPLLYRI